MVFKVSFNDFKRDPEELLKAELSTVDDVLRSGWWVLGQNVHSFESAWAKCCEVNGAVGVANGLDALEIGLRALGVGVGDEVITTSLTAYATTLAIQRSGATPVFADIDPLTACLSPTSAEQCISSKTKALVVVHLYGRSADLDSLKRLCDTYSIHLVEDCAQAHLARFGTTSVGSIGAFAAWSFYPTKNLGAVGDAGAITSNDISLLEKSRQLRNYGQTERYHHSVAGMNSRLDELQAAILVQRLPYLKEWTDQRRKIATRYFNEICSDDISLLAPPNSPAYHVHHLFVVTTNSRDSLKEYLLNQGVQTLIHYPIPCHLQSALDHFRIAPDGLSETERHSMHCLSLPIHPYLTTAEIDHVINSCNSYNA
jgi:dTDP-4-amino-4,6-dideoxygalactose transaminase